MWVRLVVDHLFTPSDRRISVQYRADQAYSVRRAWGDRMIADGVAQPIPTPPRAISGERRSPETQP